MKYNLRGKRSDPSDNNFPIPHLSFPEILLDNPKLYQNIRKNKLLSPWQGLLWFLEGLFHAVITYFAFHLLWTFHLNSIPVEFTLQEKYSFGLAIYQCVLVIQATLYVAKVS